MSALGLLTLARDNKADDIRAAVASGTPVDISNDVRECVHKVFDGRVVPREFPILGSAQSGKRL